MLTSQNNIKYLPTPPLGAQAARKSVLGPIIPPCLPLLITSQVAGGGGGSSPSSQVWPCLCNATHNATHYTYRGTKRRIRLTDTSKRARERAAGSGRLR